MIIKNQVPQIKNTQTPEQTAETIKRHVDLLGLRAPAYGRVQRVDELRAYLRLFLEPYLRDLKSKSVIKDYRIGISAVFFFKPKLRVILKNNRAFEYPLNRFILGGGGAAAVGGLIL